MWLVHRTEFDGFDELCVLLPAIGLVAFVSSQTGINQHLRYVLPAVPFLYVLAGKCVASWTWRGLLPVVAVSLVWASLSSAWCLPHSLSYFNETVGGPHRGYTCLSHSNVDWGQDLLYLKKWLEHNDVSVPVHLQYTLSCRPAVLGLDVVQEDDLASNATSPPPGWYALSVTVLQRESAGRFRRHPVMGYAGYSMRIYRIEE